MDEEAPAISSLYFYDFHSVTKRVPSPARMRYPDAFAPDGASIICAVDRFGATLRGDGITDRALERVGTL
jgi:hypothetical protein